LPYCQVELSTASSEWFASAVKLRGSRLAREAGKMSAEQPDPRDSIEEIRREDQVLTDILAFFNLLLVER
jgi:hypothetical protein